MLNPHRTTRRLIAMLAAALALPATTGARADWTTARGNPQRTGAADDRAGPREPAVLWCWKAAEHFVASPVPDAGTLTVSGLGAFNSAAVRRLSTDPTATQRVDWSKQAPYFKLPTVSSPASCEGLIVLGDGMHQTDGATLYCLWARDGRHLWQYPLPGKLVHLEGAPTVVNGRVYIGGGDAGVLAVALKQMTLDGQNLDPAAAKDLIDKRWAELLAKYEEEKKKDPDLAIPPGESALPRPAPRLLWQAGKGSWHVDAPLAVVGDRVLVPSAYVEDDKAGKRAMLCLRAGDGGVIWEQPLKLNPWAGVSVAGNVAVVGCSNIRFERKTIPGAVGEIVAFDLGSGQVKWRHDVGGGVLSAAAIRDGLAVFTATDGKVRAWNLQTGDEKWSVDVGAPMFAGSAIAGGVVYVADLDGRVHAIGLGDGKKLWTVDVAGDPSVQAPGGFYASPVLADGRLYAATCNLEGPHAGKPCAVVCLAEKSAVAAAQAAVAVTVDRAAGTASLPCRIAPRKLPTLQDIYPLEVAATFPSPRGQKAHETVVTFEARPSDVHKAMEHLGLKPGAPAVGDDGAPSGPRVYVYLEIPGPAGRPRVLPLERAIIDSRTGLPLPPLTWRFTGSAMRQPDPSREERVYGADAGGTLLTLFPVTDETVFQADMTMHESTLLRLETNRDLLPPIGTDAKLIIAVQPLASAAALAADGSLPATPPTTPAAAPSTLLDATPQASDRPTAGDDRGIGWAIRAMLTTRVAPRSTSAPFQPLAIPDPSEIHDALAPTSAPDDDPPGDSPLLPSPVTLPTTP